MSGGIDSMTMAHLFHSAGLSFAVAHCNFGLRGAASDADEDLVRAWCDASGVKLHSVRFDTRASAAAWKKGTQETARKLRYDWFSSLMKEHNYARVATAHHADDNAETFLINVFRGTGIHGLHGILPDNGKVIRPLLFARRHDIKEFAEVQGIVWREDESNQSDDYLRNAIRHRLVPEIGSLFPGFVPTINDNIVRFREAELLYNRAAEKERKSLIEQRGPDFYVPVRKLKKRVPLNTICYELFSQFGFSAAQLPDITGLLQAETGRYIASATHRIIRDRDFLVITTHAVADTDLIHIHEVPAVIETDGYRYRFSMQDVPDILKTNEDEVYLSASYVTFPLVLRRWRTGDYFYPFGMGMKKKKVSKVLIDMKVPLHEKEHIWVVESKGRILWLAGYRADERCRVMPGQQQVLKIERKAVS